MDLVLGLSMTSSSVRWVVVDGAAGEDSVTVDRGYVPVQGDLDPDALVDRLLERSVGAVGLTWTTDAEQTASAVWQAFTDRGVENVIAVSDVEAAESLAGGIATIAGCERLVVCVAEPGSSVIAAVTPDGVSADRVASAGFVDLDAFAPDAVFVLGAGDVEGVVAALTTRTDAPVVSANEAETALARGAALASASAVSILDAQESPARRRFTPTATLASVLAAAVVTFVVSLSVALGMTFTPEPTEAPATQIAGSVSEPAEEPAERPASGTAAPLEPEVRPAPPSPPAAAPVAIEVSAPEAVEIPVVPQAPPPVYEEPLAPAPIVAPEPAYVPPPAPAYVPPPAPAAPPYVPPVQAPLIPQQQAPQQPRLRDRIIERIPIINRFHEPQY